MQYANSFGGVIWTNHALDRLRERGIPQDDALLAFRHPDFQRRGKKKSAKLFIKKIADKRITLAAKQNERWEWVVVSVWIDPPLPGTADERNQREYRDYQKATFWEKVWRDVRKQLGL
ncbi:MAG: DUF4258 domain-containing protein [Candidatus Levybacteria bacterium]|nr:DUF4258 domain-containing protein [Candidatus Levybacteria bacterium]